MSQTGKAVSIAILVALIPFAFIAGKGCAPQVIHSVAPPRDTATTPAPGIVVSSNQKDSSKPTIRTRYIYISVRDTSGGFSKPDTALFAYGHKLSDGDSVNLTFTLPGDSVRWIDSIAEHAIPLPAGPPMPNTISGPVTSDAPVAVGSPLRTLSYATGGLSTRDYFSIGLGMETTAFTLAVSKSGAVSLKETLRISAEAILAPRLPLTLGSLGYLSLKGYYFF